MTDKQKAKLIYKEIKKYLRSKGVKRKFFKSANLTSLADSNYEGVRYIYGWLLDRYRLYDNKEVRSLYNLLREIVEPEIINNDYNISLDYWDNILFFEWMEYCKTFKHKLYE